MREVEIRGDMIRLGQLLKLAGLADSGAESAPDVSANRVLTPSALGAQPGVELRKTERN
jgi:ribosome-associated protein